MARVRRGTLMRGISPIGIVIVVSLALWQQAAQAQNTKCTSDSEAANKTVWPRPDSKTDTLTGQVVPQYAPASTCACADKDPWSSCAFRKLKKGASATWNSTGAGTLADDILSKMNMTSSDGDYTNVRNQLLKLIYNNGAANSFSKNVCAGGPVRLSRVAINNVASKTPFFKYDPTTSKCPNNMKVIPPSLDGKNWTVTTTDAFKYINYYPFNLGPFHGFCFGCDVRQFRWCVAAAAGANALSYDSSINDLNDYIKTRINDPFFAAQPGDPFRGYQYCPDRPNLKTTLQNYLGTFQVKGSGRIWFENAGGVEATAFMKINTDITRDAPNGLHTFGGDCIHLTSVEESAYYCYEKNSTTLADPAQKCPNLGASTSYADLKSKVDGFRSQNAYIRAEVIASSSSDYNSDNAGNHPAPYCMKNFEKLSDDRAEAAISALNLSTDRNGSLEGGIKRVTKRTGGTNGDGTSGPCAYKCNETSGTKCTESWNNIPAKDLEVNRFVAVKVYGRDKTGIQSGTSLNYATAARQCYSIDLTCDYYE